MTVRRPKGCRFWTALDLERWIRRNVPPKNRHYRTALDAARWWAACKAAEDVFEHDSRELASTFLRGIDPTRIRDISNELRVVHSTNIPSYQTDMALEAEFREFWQVPERREPGDRRMMTIAERKKAGLIDKNEQPILIARSGKDRRQF